jgi:hypothetical protein
MKRLTLSAVLFTCLTLGLASHASAQRQNNRTPLTNASIVKLVKAGFKEKTIISIMASRAVNFDLSTDAMVELKKNNVPEKVILAMLSEQQGMMADDDDLDFGSDSGFKSNFPSQSSSPGNGNSSDIFGNSSGNRSETKTRGGRGGNSGDTMTTGSATVRLIRPPAEAGAPPKLDKAPTLNNDSIVEMVAAGFTDGTIIRRIEQSPVDFDLSPDKLAELRKRRVSDKVLDAMKVAMGDSGDTKTQPANNGSPKQRN